MFDIAQTSTAAGGKVARGARGRADRGQIKHKIAGLVSAARYENTTARFELLAFHQVQPS
jgi:hypothetical protein